MWRAMCQTAVRQASRLRFFGYQPSVKRPPPVFSDDPDDPKYQLGSKRLRRSDKIEADMARYRVLERTFLRAVGNDLPRLYERGAIVNFDGTPGSSLEPLDHEARKRFVAGGKTRATKSGPSI